MTKAVDTVEEARRVLKIVAKAAGGRVIFGVILQFVGESFDDQVLYMALE